MAKAKSEYVITLFTGILMKAPEFIKDKLEDFRKIKFQKDFLKTNTMNVILPIIYKTCEIQTSTNLLRAKKGHDIMKFHPVLSEE